jgi:hypothetical protein
VIGFDAPDRPHAPCEDINLADLFTSTLQADHQIAASYCNKGRKLDPAAPECVFLVACHAKLTAEIEASTGANSSVEGTWAGELVGVPGRPGRPRKKAAA